MAVEFAKFRRTELMDVNTIIVRALKLAEMAGVDYDRKSIHMDLCAAHAHTPLRIKELAEADDLNFAHDIFGIRSHLNRTTGDLINFRPRFAR